MDFDKITQDLNKRFAAPLAEFYRRRIIFWRDEDREFEELVEGLELEQAKVLKLTGSNTFAAKKLLAADDTESNYLVYSPFATVAQEDNWLLNIELYSEEFRADLPSIQMEEMGLYGDSFMRGKVKDHRKFFNNSEYLRRIADMARHIKDTQGLNLAMLAVLSGVKEQKPGEILRSVLSAGLIAEENPVYANMQKYGLEEKFWMMAYHATGYNGGSSPNLGQLAAQVLLTAGGQNIRMEELPGLERYISTQRQAFCYEMVAEWLQPRLMGEDRNLYELAREVEDMTGLREKLLQLSVEELAEGEVFPCINECILQRLMEDINQDIIDEHLLRRIQEKRRTKAWYEAVACYYDGLREVANMREFYMTHADGFHLAQAKDIWQAYEKDYYRMDSYYRQFHLSFSQSLKEGHELLDDPFKHVADVVERLYNHWYLNKLAGNWTTSCADEMAKQGLIAEVAQQRYFYDSKVASDGNRVYVVISDALRYEVAATLAERLRSESNSTVKLESMQAVFPTITKFGMAALLPHRQLSVERRGKSVAVLADGEPTDMNDRDGVLKKAKATSVALQYRHINPMKKAERVALVKGMDVVYIYHDKIDEASHTADNLVFPACEDAMDELRKIVRMICNEFGGTHIYITADHGFLYTYSPLTEDGKVGIAGFKQGVVEQGRRYALLSKDATPDYLMPVQLPDAQADMAGYAPRENTRLKMNGGGLNFVHGGISLQEMMVPVIEYRHVRASTKAYQQNREKFETRPVELQLVTSSRKISNLLFSLQFHQTEAVGDKRVPSEYVLYFTDAAGDVISDMQRIIADKTDSNPQERIFRCNFSLKNRKYNNYDSYYLVMAEERGNREIRREEFRIDIPFAMDDFYFFD